MAARALRHDTPTNRPLTPSQRRSALRKIDKLIAKNSLRRVRTHCCGWVRDPLAQVGDWVWCDTHSDTTRVIEGAE